MPKSTTSFEKSCKFLKQVPKDAIKHLKDEYLSKSSYSEGEKEVLIRLVTDDRMMPVWEAMKGKPFSNALFYTVLFKRNFEMQPLFNSEVLRKLDDFSEWIDKVSWLLKKTERKIDTFEKSMHFNLVKSEILLDKDSKRLRVQFEDFFKIPTRSISSLKDWLQRHKQKIDKYKKKRKCELPVFKRKAPTAQRTYLMKQLVPVFKKLGCQDHYHLVAPITEIVFDSNGPVDGDLVRKNTKRRC